MKKIKILDQINRVLPYYNQTLQLTQNSQVPITVSGININSAPYKYLTLMQDSKLRATSTPNILNTLMTYSRGKEYEKIKVMASQISNDQRKYTLHKKPIQMEKPPRKVQRKSFPTYIVLQMTDHFIFHTIKRKKIMLQIGLHLEIF